MFYWSLKQFWCSVWCWLFVRTVEYADVQKEVIYLLSYLRKWSFLLSYTLSNYLPEWTFFSFRTLFSALLCIYDLPVSLTKLLPMIFTPLFHLLSIDTLLLSIFTFSPINICYVFLYSLVYPSGPHLSLLGALSSSWLGPLKIYQQIFYVTCTALGTLLAWNFMDKTARFSHNQTRYY